MTTLHKLGARASLVAACVVILLQWGSAQKAPAPADAAHTRQVLVANARALESRGRPDMAIQVWQQVLLSDPNNTEALAGVARDLRLNGSIKESDQALDKLRSVNPKDPAIDQIEGLFPNGMQSQQLRHAGELARQGKNDQAMTIYRQHYGDHPPDGDIALAYYQTLYGATGGKDEAIAGLRALMQRNSADPRYAIELGRILTYDPKTRTEGIHLLEQHPQDPDARDALRQALIWNSANPATAPELRAYLREHPGDSEIAQRLRDDEAKLSRMNSGLARTPDERAAYAALNARRLDEAEKRFTAILQAQPNDGPAAAGMGFVRMQQQNFGGAISYLTQAEQNGTKSVALENALATSRFWFTMSEAAQAAEANQFEVAQDKYRAALAMHPNSIDALNGLAGLLLKAQQFDQAAGVYSQLLKAQPANADAWRGLFVSYAQGGRNQQALDFAKRFPPRIRAAMDRDPEYLRTLATIYQSEGRPADAQKVLNQALALPFPDNGMKLKEDTRLQYASILMIAGRFSQAAEMYTQILKEDPSNISAWMGLVSAHHQLSQDSQAVADVEKMPPASYESALNDPSFLAMLGSIYQQTGKLEIAQNMLERSARLQTAAGRQPTMQLDMQLAGIYLQRGDTDKAYPIYRRVLTAHPDRQDAWKGLIATLQATNHTSEAFEQLGEIPPDVRKQLEMDPGFIEIEASIYASAGDTRNAMLYIGKVQRYYAGRHELMPPSLAIQNAWLLYNGGDDRGLYRALMEMGSRTDLTNEQRETVQTIWANWAVRRAGAAMDNNDNDRAVEILEAASLSFPDNLQVKWILAGGYLRAGRAKQSLELYKKLPIQDASADQFQGAVGASLAVNDRTTAETWLRLALARYPHDYRVLGMAARYEQARGDNERAADYWRAALKAMPPNSPTDRLAHDLDYPDQDASAHKGVTASDLQLLLNPDYEGNKQRLPGSVTLPPLPSYGPDPYQERTPDNAAPPVAPQDSPRPSTPDTTQSPQPQAGAPVGRAGQVTLPPSDEYITTTDANPVPSAKSPQSRQPAASAPQVQKPAAKDAPPVFIPAPDDSSQSPQPALHPQSMKGEAQIRQLGNVPVLGPDQQAPAAVASVAPILDGATPILEDAQYTPSAQQAATGAYSAQKPSATQAGANQAAPNQAAPPANTPSKKHRKKKTAAQAASSTETAPTLSTAPSEQNPAQPPAQQAQPSAPEQAPAPDSNAGATDEQLEQQNLPPLRGPWIRIQRQPRPVSPREEAEQQLQTLESGFSGWLGGAGIVDYRSGTPGYDRLAILEAPFEASAPLGYHARLVLVAKPVFLDSGQADGSSQITVQEFTSTGRRLVSIPQPLGTDIATGPSGSTTTFSPPPQQNAAGVAVEGQFIAPQFAFAVGYTPLDFLVKNWTARAYLRPGNGPFTFTFSRDSIRDSQLSFSGLHDPGSATLTYPGVTWGGVVADQGNLEFSRGDAMSGFYAGLGGQFIDGSNVRDNYRIDGNGGAYWRAKAYPEYGTLSVGANFFGMHYANNQEAFSFGMGGYFSPQFYFLANVPVTWEGHYQTHWHYEIVAGLGIQAFQQDATPLFPLAGQKNYETLLNNAELPNLTSISANWDMRGNASYQISPHWFAGFFVSGNDTRNFNFFSAGFSVHYMFRSQPSAVAGPTGLFPNDGLRPFTVP